MKFRNFFIVNRVVAPIAFAILAVSMLIPHSPIVIALQVIGGVPFAVVCLLGAYRGLKLQSSDFIPMRCPFCEGEGIAGCGVSWSVGWWLRCETCGIVRPQGLFGLTFTSEVVDDTDDDSDDS